MKALRQSLRQQRRNISSSDRIKFSKNLLNQVHKLSNFHDGQKVAIYLPNDGEIDPKYIHNFLKMIKISVYLPILVGKKLKFAKVGKNFRKNRFGILEPVFSQILDANQMNVIFMPLVGFDQYKNRIGMGGGFYDRTLAFKKRQQGFKNPKLYGLAFDCQQVEQLDTQDWDIPLDAIITPSSIY
jgi:5-formyltetrahydrofolate cyclo-ligase